MQSKYLGWIGNTQTGKNGQLVKKVFVTEAFDILEEYYAAITLDRNEKWIIYGIIWGGIDIEKVAEKTPEKITKFG